jgi:hypothetical protein
MQLMILAVRASLSNAYIPTSPAIASSPFLDVSRIGKPAAEA